ncbi:hypothetical protein BD413DRAFT_490278 [Trametes elegans]|nr:hypothetical protein BD413DRAFT_490278 [Trametes elegans]
MSRLCKSTQDIPAPLGPRRPHCARSAIYTAPPAPGTDSAAATRTIPLDKFAAVLHDPWHFCEVYPGALPLTRKVYGQLWRAHAMAASVLDPGAVSGSGVAGANGGCPGVAPVLSPTQAQMQTDTTAVGGGKHERLATAGDDVVQGGAGSLGKAATGTIRRPLPPIQNTVDVHTQNQGVIGDRRVCANTSVRRVTLNTNPFTAAIQDPALLASYRSGLPAEMNGSMMNLLERGEWSYWPIQPAAVPKIEEPEDGELSDMELSDTREEEWAYQSFEELFRQDASVAGPSWFR